MQFLRNLARAWRIANNELRYVELVDRPDAWTQEDFSVTAAFMRSHTGDKLRQRLTNMVFRAQAAACSAPRDATFNIGVARGVALTINALQEHFSPAGGGVTNRPSDTDE